MSNRSRSNTFSALLAAVVILALTSVTNAAPDAQQILAASDAIRNPGKPFALTTTLVEYRSGKQADSNTLTVYSKADNNSGQFRSLIRFLAPARDANKLMLKSGNDLWFYDPSSKAS
ncbi:MAG TPA: outer membrane lipoprotein-sorting protein, partial [Burkholderiales bacterium]|nr:outer membrane lipoprotein-sorting protein [Burkholderiales bacterium]